MQIAQSQKTNGAARRLSSTAPVPRFEQLQASLPDTCDNPGKPVRRCGHNLAFVPTALLWALLRSGGHLSVSRLHRWLVREYDWLKGQTGHSSPKAISDAQLRRLLAGLDYQAYNAFNGAYFGWVSRESGVWHSVEGKELRGSIDGVSGQNRGENFVRLVGHEDAQAQLMGFYRGLNESERQVVEQYFKSQPADSLKGQRFSLDALHTTPTLLSLLNQGEAGYVVGLKANKETRQQVKMPFVASRPTDYELWPAC